MYGSLAYHLRLAASALRLRWLWLQRTDPSRPWSDLQLAFGRDREVSTLFRNSIDINLGDGNRALFWSDRWNGSASPCCAAPDLCAMVRPGLRTNRTVAQALHNKAWIQ